MGKVEIKLRSAAPAVYSLETEYGLDEILCEKKSAARSEAVVTAVAFVMAVLSVIAGYFLITIISGLAFLSGIFSLSGIKRSARKAFSENGERTRLYEFYTDGFLEYVIPKSEKTDIGFTKFLNKKIKRRKNNEDNR